MTNLNITLAFEYGELVYLKTDPEQRQRMITAFTYRNGLIFYEVSFGAAISVHTEVEISSEKNVECL